MALRRFELGTAEPYGYPRRGSYGRHRYRGRRDRRAWLPLLGLLPIVAAVAAVALWTEYLRDDDSRASAPATTAAVASARTTSTAQPPPPAPPAAPTRLALARDGTPLVPVPSRSRLAEFRGSYVEARGIRVQSVVGPSVFWVGGPRQNRMLVHLARDGAARRPIRRGDRLSFAATLARTPPDAARRWGVTPAEGAFVVGFHGHHLEVEPSKIRFA